MTQRNWGLRGRTHGLQARNPFDSPDPTWVRYADRLWIGVPIVIIVWCIGAILGLILFGG